MSFLGRLLNAFSKKDLYKIIYVHPEELNAFPEGIGDIYHGKLDGIVIRGFLSNSEIERVKRLADSINEKLHMEVPYGSVIGFPLNAAKEDRSQYFEKAIELKRACLDVFGFDIDQRLTNSFQQLSKSTKVTVPIEEGNAYNSSTFRIMRSGGGGLRAHTGNEFLEIHQDGAMAWLKKHAAVFNSMSYFLLISKPDSQGELTLYDLKWSDSKTKKVKGFKGNDRDDTVFESMKKQVVEMEEGDLVVFAGGRIWHNVTNIEGQKSRYTFGGFMAFDKDLQELWFWS
jgi:hypothetical protein